MKKKFPSLYQDNTLQSGVISNTKFIAIKKLNETDAQLQSLKNRVRVLQSNDRNNCIKIANHQEKIEKLQIVRNNHVNQIKKMNVTKHQQQTILEELRQKNQIKRRLMKDRIDEVMDEIAQQKVRQYLQICQQREVIENKISYNRQNQLSKKQFQRNKIVELEEEGKQKFNQFLETKVQNILRTNKQEANKIDRKRAQKQLQLQKMSDLEAQLLKKQSESLMAYNNLKQKLDNMLGTSKVNSRVKQNSLKKSKLTQSVHSRTQLGFKKTESQIR